MLPFQRKSNRRNRPILTELTSSEYETVIFTKDEVESGNLRVGPIKAWVGSIKAWVCSIKAWVCSIKAWVGSIKACVSSGKSFNHQYEICDVNKIYCSGCYLLLVNCHCKYKIA